MKLWQGPSFHYVDSVHGRIDKVLATAKQNPKTVKLANIVEKARMKEWLTHWKFKRKETFRFLNLDEAGKRTFTGPNFKVWAKYLNDFNRKYPGKKATMIDSIRESYNDHYFVQILDTTQMITRAEKVARKLKNSLLDKWVDEKGTVAHLKRQIGRMSSSNAWIERYAETLSKFS